jgi:hypothetical protein
MCAYYTEGGAYYTEGTCAVVRAHYTTYMVNGNSKLRQNHPGKFHLVVSRSHFSGKRNHLIEVHSRINTTYKSLS